VRSDDAATSRSGDSVSEKDLGNALRNVREQVPSIDKTLQGYRERRREYDERRRAYDATVGSRSTAGRPIAPERNYSV
jgi:hypothetical protein